MTTEELNWLLQTIQDAADADRFVLAQYARGRISFQLMADIARKRDWVNRTANQFAAHDQEIGCRDECWFQALQRAIRDAA
jgi:hypothetical protein